MKHIFFTTTILALGAVSAGTAHSQEVQTLSSAEFTQLNEAVETTSIAIGLHTGDFQAITRAGKTNHMFRGEGSSLMHTARYVRD